MAILGLICVVLLTAYTSAAFQTNNGRVVDCAYGPWSEYNPFTTGLLIRTRQIVRHNKNGGAPCTGDLQQIRNEADVSTPSLAKFLTFFLSGDRRTTTLASPLRRGQVPTKYQFSRDIVFVIDRTLFAPAFPLYKSLISNLIGSVCGDVGRTGSGNIYSLITYDAKSTYPLHSFSQKQTKLAIQNKVLTINPSDGLGQPSKLGDAINRAHGVITSASSGTRAYHLSHKDVVLFVTYRSLCDLNAAEANSKLKVNGRVYVVVLGESGDSTSPSPDWCLKDFASQEFEFHFLWVKSFDELREFSTWALEITSYLNPCADPSTQGQEKLF